MASTKHDALIAARKAKGLTQVDLARAIDTAQSHVSRMENGDSNITPQLAARIAAVLDVSEMQLIYPTRFSAELQSASPVHGPSPGECGQPTPMNAANTAPNRNSDSEMSQIEGGADAAAGR